MHFIYGLRTNLDSRIMYVGITNSPARRLIEHIETARRGHSQDRDKWALKQIESGAEINMIILDTYDSEPEARAAEKHWVIYLSGINPQICNMRHGAKSKGFCDSRQFELRLGTPDIITPDMAEVALKYRDILFDKALLGVNKVSIDGVAYDFNIGNKSQKWLDKKNVAWHEIPELMHELCAKLFDLAGMSGTFTECMAQAMVKHRLSPGRIFTAAMAVEMFREEPKNAKERTYATEVNSLRKVLGREPSSDNRICQSITKPAQPQDQRRYTGWSEDRYRNWNLY
jgi:predicted GIY-YIG superfamily endonuclease